MFRRSVVQTLSASLLTLGAVTVGAAAPAPTIQTLPNSNVVTYLGSTPGWFICDSLDGPGVAEMGWPDANGRSRLTTYSKASAGTYSYQNYRVGAADAGAGQVYYPLTPSAPSSDGSGGPNAVGSFNPGALTHPEQVLTPNIVTLKSAELSGDCRWTLNTRLLGFDKSRSFVVSQAPGGALTYQTWNYGDPVRKVNPDGVQRTSTPSLSIAGGTRTLSSSQETFTFQNAGYTYTVRVARQGQPAGASVTVSRGGKVVQTEALTGYTYAVRR
ncbi:hypothetical protein [Deinococcus sp. UYEF24]